jgi:hypothetical protein
MLTDMLDLLRLDSGTRTPRVGDVRARAEATLSLRTPTRALVAIDQRE